MENLEQGFPETLLAGNAPTTLRAHVVKILSASILSGKYRPGDRLNESQIARDDNQVGLNVAQCQPRRRARQLAAGRSATHFCTADVSHVGSLLSRDERLGRFRGGLNGAMAANNAQRASRRP